MSEDFLSRWSRLKHESAAGPVDHGVAQTNDSASVPPAAPVTDVSSLPAIESLSAESTVAAFLREGVPEDLTRAALRKAWTSDPAIRDFVGIAENQWDFNAEGAIAGFGSLSAEEYARHIAALALRAAGSTASPQLTDNDGPSLSPSIPPSQIRPAPRLPIGAAQAKAATPAGVSECTGGPQARRTHGTALPR